MQPFGEGADEADALECAGLKLACVIRLRYPLAMRR
jgi:hypothetical protein